MKTLKFRFVVCARECSYCGSPLDDNGKCSNTKCGNS